MHKFIFHKKVICSYKIFPTVGLFCRVLTMFYFFKFRGRSTSVEAVFDLMFHTWNILIPAGTRDLTITLDFLVLLPK